MGERDTTCDRCGSPRPAEGSCPRCGAASAPDWSAPIDPAAPRASGPAPGAAGSRPSSRPSSTPPPPPAPVLSSTDAGTSGASSGNRGCRRAAIIVGVVVVLVLVLGAIGVFTFLRSFGDSDFRFDVDEEGFEFGDEVPDTHGDDPTLDALWDGCEEGDMADCDQLYLDAPFGSEYEEFGDTCGHRQEPGMVCDQ